MLSKEQSYTFPAYSGTFINHPISHDELLHKKVEAPAQRLLGKRMLRGKVNRRLLPKSVTPDTRWHGISCRLK